MSIETSPENIARWDRWFAIEMNNLAWDIAANPARSAAQREEMLHAAHASVIHWKRIGRPLNIARAEMLLGEVHALLGEGASAMLHARRSYEYIAAHESPDWEVALAHAVLAHAAYAAGDTALHAEHYALARKLGDAIADPDDRAPFESTFAQVPTPGESAPA